MSWSEDVPASVSTVLGSRASLGPAFVRGVGSGPRGDADRLAAAIADIEYGYCSGQIVWAEIFGAAHAAARAGAEPPDVAAVLRAAADASAEKNGGPRAVARETIDVFDAFAEKASAKTLAEAISCLRIDPLAAVLELGAGATGSPAAVSALVWGPVLSAPREAAEDRLVAILRASVRPVSAVVCADFTDDLDGTSSCREDHPAGPHADLCVPNAAAFDFLLEAIPRGASPLGSTSDAPPFEELALAADAVAAAVSDAAEHSCEWAPDALASCCRLLRCAARAVAGHPDARAPRAVAGHHPDARGEDDPAARLAGAIEACARVFGGVLAGAGPEGPERVVELGAALFTEVFLLEARPPEERWHDLRAVAATFGDAARSSVRRGVPVRSPLVSGSPDQEAGLFLRAALVCGRAGRRFSELGPVFRDLGEPVLAPEELLMPSRYLAAVLDQVDALARLACPAGAKLQRFHEALSVPAALPLPRAPAPVAPPRLEADAAFLYEVQRRAVEQALARAEPP